MERGRLDTWAFEELLRGALELFRGPVLDQHRQPGAAGCGARMGALNASRALPHATKAGHRIEPGEVRTMPLSHDEVAEAAVSLCGKDLGAHVSPVLAEEEIRAYLSASLPRQLVPWFLVFLDHLPHAVNGKIDRNALPARVTAASRSSTPPRTTTSSHDGTRSWRPRDEPHPGDYRHATAVASAPRTADCRQADSGSGEARP
ncbi:hypothetical protein ABT218_30645 [Streptomyces sp. NPDC001455]|uniref:hypothetical protein n=1 Tax=Streptomyces sp. NPDC001455 TaxID=3154518 RepID=UPI003325AC5C